MFPKRGCKGLKDLSPALSSREGEKWSMVNAPLGSLGRFQSEAGKEMVNIPPMKPEGLLRPQAGVSTPVHIVHEFISPDGAAEVCHPFRVCILSICYEQGFHPCL